MRAAVDRVDRLPFGRLAWKQSVMRVVGPDQWFKNWRGNLRGKSGFHGFFAIVVMTQGGIVNPFMERAIQLSLQNVRAGLGGPFAALVVRDEKILATGVNQVTTAFD